MSEKTSYSTLRKAIMQPRDRIDRIENVVGTGMPDVNLVLSGVELWIEIKSPMEPKKDNTTLFGSNHPLSQDQMNWFKRQMRAGGKAFVYIDTDKHRILINGTWADRINTMTVQELLDEAAWWSMKPTFADQWKQLRSVLVKHG
jgi:hypothetical protein